MLIGSKRTCDCEESHSNCLTAKEWAKNQVGIWEFYYEKRDIRDKSVHPAVYPISLARRVIEQFTHEGELVVDPFCGSGTTLIAAKDAARNAVGFDLSRKYVEVAQERLDETSNLFAGFSQQAVICEDAWNIQKYFDDESVNLIVTSPPYADLLNAKKGNKSYRNRSSDQLGVVSQYSQNSRDLGTMEPERYIKAMGNIFDLLYSLLKPGSHCVINVSDMWKDGKRILLHMMIIEELRKYGYELKNIIIWDKRNLINGMGIFGWPNNYITMGTTFEYLLDFYKPLQ